MSIYSQLRRSLSFVLMLSALTFWSGANDLALAQNDQQPTETATVITVEESVTPVPTEETGALPEQPTSEPTIIPTLEVPTATPTEAPTGEPLTPETSPSTVPVEASTPEVVLSPTVETASPIFTFDNGTAFDYTAGIPFTFQGSVSDTLGIVRIVTDTTSTAGMVTLTTTDPTEVASPYITRFSLSYSAAEGFSGTDTFSLTAINGVGASTTVYVTINVTLALPTLPATLEPTPTVTPMKEMLIDYNPAATEETIQHMLATLNAVEQSRIPQLGVMRVLMPEVTAGTNAIVSTLQSNHATTLAGVTTIEPNDAYYLSFVPNDPKFSQQWGYSNTNGGIYAPYAWDTSITRGIGITIAVLDSGVDLQHPDLANQMVAGWDFVNDDNNPDDDNGHGTHVAGVIAARSNNAMGVAGVAYNAKIMPIKVCDAANACPYYYIAAGIVQAVDAGARIINLSLGGPANSSTVQGAVNYALSRNVIVVAAAGNTGDSDNSVQYPAALQGVISVAAHAENGNIASFSTHNTQVDISAPGVGILSTVPIELDLDGTNDGYDTYEGTSMAAPFVSGTAALLMSAKVATTPATILDALTCGAEDAGSIGYDEYYGNGRLKADLAMNWRLNSASCTVTQPNDSFMRATTIPRLPYKVVQPVHSRSVTEEASDPQICGTNREQTLWYTFRPTMAGYYQFATLGSSYNTVIGVFRGSVGSLTSVGCTTSSQQAFPLDASINYYIAIGTNGAPVDGAILQLLVNVVMVTNNIDYQENAPAIAYSGMWLRGAVVGASGGYTQQTTDTGASASFSFRGTHFDYVRTVGPDRGAVQVYINGELLLDPVTSQPIIISNRAAITRPNQVVSITVPGGVVGRWNAIQIVPYAGTPGIVDVDRIRTFDFDNTTLAGIITTKADDRDTRLRYISTGFNNDWMDVSLTTAYSRTLRETSTQDAGIAFRMRGNALTIFRMTGSGYASMQVTIDNVITLTISNTASSDGLRSYTIDNLVNTDHVVEIRKVGASGSIQIDAVQPAVLVTMSPNITYDERNVLLAYRGLWTDTNSVAGAYSSTNRTLEAGSEVSFKFTGNDLCLAYKRPNSDLQIHVDGNLIHTIPAGGGTGFTSWCLDANAFQLLADTTHYARLVTNGGTFTLDSVRAQRYNTITPARLLLQETDLSFRYSQSTDWVTVTTPAISMGGFRPQGGSLKSSFTDNTTITFYINGTGFILYTAVGPNRGCWEMMVDGVTQSPIDLLDNLRYRPLGYGVSGLAPGIHRIVLRADTDCSSIYAGGLGATFAVDFDALRVFP